MTIHLWHFKVEKYQVVESGLKDDNASLGSLKVSGANITFFAGFSPYTLEASSYFEQASPYK